MGTPNALTLIAATGCSAVLNADNWTYKIVNVAGALRFSRKYFGGTPEMQRLTPVVALTPCRSRRLTSTSLTKTATTPRSRISNTRF